MSASVLLIHLLTFAAPAFFVALIVALLCHATMRKRSGGSGFWKQVAIMFVSGLIVLASGLWFFGDDGRMFTYATLIVVAATAQWWMLRGWRG